MNQEDIQKMLETLSKGGININGDLVLEKHVEHEIGNVENGGIGIQIINGKQETTDKQVRNENSLPRVDNSRALSPHRQSIVNELLDLTENGDWREGITADDVKEMLKTVLGLGEVALEGEEATMSEQLWRLLEYGRGNRVKVVWQNIVGLLDEKYFFVIKGTPSLNADFFGDKEGYSNIDKGRPRNACMSGGYQDVLPLLDKYMTLKGEK